MPMEAGKNMQTNLKDRFTALREAVKSEVDLVKGIAGDVKKRVVDGEELTYIQTLGIQGKRGGISDIPLAFIIATADNITKGAVDQAKITRRWTKR